MKNKVIKVISLLTALVTLFSFAACGGNNNEETTTTNNGEEVVATDVITNESGETEIVTIDPKEPTEESNDKTTSEKDDKTTSKKDDGKTTTKKDDKTTTGSTGNNDKTTNPTTTKVTTTAKKTYTKEEIVKICTDAINKAKNKSPGYTKKKYQKLEGDRSVIPGAMNMVFGLFEEDTVKTYKKGDADVNSFGVDGYVKTKVSDLKTCTMEEKDSKYIINYTFDKEKNPADLNSKHGRTMDIMTRDEVLDIGSLIFKDVTMNYYGGFLKAEIDKKTGNLVYMQMGSNVDAYVVPRALLGDPFTAKKIRSVATYTDFKW